MRKPNIILLTDYTSIFFLMKTYGVFKVAHELRLAGYEVVVLNHLHIYTIDEINYLLKNLINEETLFVGINNFFYKDIGQPQQRSDGGIEYPICEPGSMLPHGYGYNQQLINTIKDANPNCKISLGGPYASDAEWNKDFDYVLCGYSDSSIVNLANHLSNNEPLRKAHRSVYGPTIVNDSTAESFDIYTGTMSYTNHDVILPGSTLNLEISRGCIFSCAFCSYPLNGKKKLDFLRDPELIYQEIMENYERHQVTRYLFVDDTFNDSVDKVKMVYDISKRLPFKMEFWANCRVDLLHAHPETIDMLVEAGLSGIYMGIESFNKKTAETIGKGAAQGKQMETIAYLKNKWQDKVMLHGSFIVGLPHESIESVTNTFNALMDPDCKLDSWVFYGFQLDDIETKSNNFHSKITKDPGKYGYRIKGKNSHSLIWENDYMDYYTAQDLAQKFNSQGVAHKHKISGMASFEVADLGYDIEFSRNKLVSKFDWDSLRDRKALRAQEYKETLYTQLGIPPFDPNFILPKWDKIN